MTKCFLFCFLGDFQEQRPTCNFKQITYLESEERFENKGPRSQNRNFNLTIFVRIFDFLILSSLRIESFLPVTNAMLEKKIRESKYSEIDIPVDKEPKYVLKTKKSEIIKISMYLMYFKYLE